MSLGAPSVPGNAAVVGDMQQVGVGMVRPPSRWRRFIHEVCIMLAHGYCWLGTHPQGLRRTARTVGAIALFSVVELIALRGLVMFLLTAVVDTVEPHWVSVVPPLPATDPAAAAFLRRLSVQLPFLLERVFVMAVTDVATVVLIAAVRVASSATRPPTAAYGVKPTWRRRLTNYFRQCEPDDLEQWPVLVGLVLTAVVVATTAAELALRTVAVDNPSRFNSVHRGVGRLDRFSTRTPHTPLTALVTTFFLTAIVSFVVGRGASLALQPLLPRPVNLMAERNGHHA